MEDFLKDRPVIPAAEATIALKGGSAPSVLSGGTLAPLRRETAPPVTPPAAVGAPAAAKAGAAKKAPETHVQTGEHGTKVETVVERGRVTRIIVTCSCGKVTEIACNY